MGLGEVGGACTYDAMVQMFQTKMAGEGNDPDDLIVQAFKAYDIEGKIEIDEDNMIKSKDVIGLFVAQKEEEKKEEAAPVEEAPAEEAPAEDKGGAKKKKKKKKAAK